MTGHDEAFVTEANTTGRTPVVFASGHWVHRSCWEAWVPLFRRRGYVAHAPDLPGGPATVRGIRDRPATLACRGVGDPTGYYRQLIARLDTRPVLIGHCRGGLIAQTLLGEDAAAAGVAIASAPARDGLITDRGRGPLLVVGAGADRVIPVATARAAFGRYASTPSITDYAEFDDRDHSLVVDSAWRDIAEYTIDWLAFVGHGPR